MVDGVNVGVPGAPGTGPDVVNSALTAGALAAKVLNATTEQVYVVNAERPVKPLVPVVDVVAPINSSGPTLTPPGVDVQVTE